MGGRGRGTPQIHTVRMSSMSTTASNAGRSDTDTELPAVAFAVGRAEQEPLQVTATGGAEGPAATAVDTAEVDGAALPVALLGALAIVAASAAVAGAVVTG